MENNIESIEAGMRSAAPLTMVSKMLEDFSKSYPDHSISICCMPVMDGREEEDISESVIIYEGHKESLASRIVTAATMMAIADKRLEGDSKEIGKTAITAMCAGYALASSGREPKLVYSILMNAIKEETLVSFIMSALYADIDASRMKRTVNNG